MAKYITSETIYLLLYSGGVDSTLSLAKLIDNNIIPYIFHFKTKKLTNKHEKQIKRNAQKLSPQSPYYVFETETYNFEFGMYPNGKCFVVINNDEEFLPFDICDCLVTGHWRRDNDDEILKWICDFATYSKQLILPLKDYTYKQIMREFYLLPLDIKKNVVASTRVNGITDYVCAVI